MRCCHLFLSSFVLNERLRADWRQFYARNEELKADKEQFATLSSSRTLSITEANQLVVSLTSHGDEESVGDVVKYIREELQELQPFHYNQLLRVFNFHRDKDNAQHVFEAAFNSQNSDEQTYGLVVDALHCIGAHNSTEVILQAIAAMHNANVPLVVGEGSARHSFVLTSLLHHVVSRNYSPIVAALVAFWMRALGAHLGDWDIIHLLSSFVLGYAYHTTFARCFEEEASPPGHVSFTSLSQKLKAEVSAHSSSSRALRLLIESVEASLDHHMVSHDEPVDCVFVNRGASCVQSTIQHIFELVSQFKGVGPARSAINEVYHGYLLLLNGIGLHSEVVKLLEDVSQHYVAWQEQYGREGDVHANEGETEEDIARSSDFGLNDLFLIDASDSLLRLGLGSRQRVAKEYHELAQIIQQSSPTLAGVLAATELHFIHTEAEGELALKEICQLQSSHNKLARWSRQMIRAFLTFCLKHTPRNLKYAAADLKDRDKWALYCEARQTAMLLHGSGPGGRELMKHVYYSGNKLPQIRDEETVRKDTEIFQKLFAIGKVSLSPSSNLPLPTQQPIFRSHNMTPVHLWDPKVTNTFPHERMGIPPDFSVAKQDPFPTIKQIIFESDVKWYLQDNMAFVLLLRNLLYRLKWSEALKLMKQLPSVGTFVDQEINLIFYELGDTNGAYPFKVASAVFDSSLHEDTPSSSSSSKL